MNGVGYLKGPATAVRFHDHGILERGLRCQSQKLDAPTDVIFTWKAYVRLGVCLWQVGGGGG